jgi:uncharacterized surface protein with fasciclin (FAS1) repeats
MFAPTNTAFEKLPKETLEALMKDDKKAEMLQDGQVFNQANSKNVTISFSLLL